MKMSILESRNLLILSIVIVIIVVTITILIGWQPCGWLDLTIERSGCLSTLDHDRISSATFAPDGATLATVSFDDTIALWSVSNETPQRTLLLEMPTVNDVSFSPDRNIWALGSGMQTDILRVDGGTLLRTVDKKSYALTIAFGPNGDILAVGSGGGVVRLWRVSDGTLLHTLEPDIDRYDRMSVNSVAFSPDGEILASGGDDNTVRLWRVSDGVLLRTLDGHTWKVKSVAFSPDGKTLASGARDGTVRLWRVSDGTLLHTLNAHTGTVHSVVYSPDGTILISGGTDGAVRVWRGEDGTLLHTMKTGGWYGNWVLNVAISPDGTTLAVGQRYGPLRLFDVQEMLKE